MGVDSERGQSAEMELAAEGRSKECLRKRKRQELKVGILDKSLHILPEKLVLQF